MTTLDWEIRLVQGAFVGKRAPIDETIINARLDALPSNSEAWTLANARDFKEGPARCLPDLCAWTDEDFAILDALLNRRPGMCAAYRGRAYRDTQR